MAEVGSAVGERDFLHAAAAAAPTAVGAGLLSSTCPSGALLPSAYTPSRMTLFPGQIVQVMNQHRTGVAIDLCLVGCMRDAPAPVWSIPVMYCTETERLADGFAIGHACRTVAKKCFKPFCVTNAGCKLHAIASHQAWKVGCAVAVHATSMLAQLLRVQLVMAQWATTLLYITLTVNSSPWESARPAASACLLAIDAVMQLWGFKAAHVTGMHC